MSHSEFYNDLLRQFKALVEKNGLWDEPVEVMGRPMTPEEAIGKPERTDYPILKGKERLMQAVFRGEKGQAFTDMPGDFSGTLKEIIERPLNTNYDIAVVISTINAVTRYLGLCDRTVHCRDEDPETCARELVNHIRETCHHPRIALIGYQPAMLQHLSEHFDLRAVDLDRDNIGTVRYGVEIEDGRTKTEEVLHWCELILATGSTAANATITRFLNEKPVIFFGTTVAGPAALMNLDRFCACGT